MEVPDSAPEFEGPDSAELMNTIQGICNESTLTRIEIIGALEAVKHCMLRSWEIQEEG